MGCFVGRGGGGLTRYAAASPFRFPRGGSGRFGGGFLEGAFAAAAAPGGVFGWHVRRWAGGSWVVRLGMLEEWWEGEECG